MATGLLNRLFTITEYHAMIDNGILTENDRVELIKGEIVYMSPIGRRHAAQVKRIAEVLYRYLLGRVTIGVQDPVELDNHSEPLPDISLLQRRGDFYQSAHPQPEDILLLVEVADTTAETDKAVEITLYAENNIVEVWLVDINAQSVEVYREPSGNGYQRIQRLQRGQTLSILALPDIEMTVDEVLGEGMLT
ncbi:MAG TPA: Uma2 family endonuclease [Oscillatoriaceae cyanobacterium M33_DOE_052]|uniref:Uma2 family endonuclease n=1 Tax=Planktothricoides sp. SpSt-374 TaxID=2282167 RepID=A0A7C3VS85_9CYAN|nr:Uma2 family endonuclease [Oscillatoriaceae cyanobacterium M33_DOE_052]